MCVSMCVAGLGCGKNDAVMEKRKKQIGVVAHAH